MMTNFDCDSYSSGRSRSCTIVFGLYDPNVQTISRICMPDPTPIDEWGLCCRKLYDTLSARIVNVLRCDSENVTKVVALGDRGSRITICCRDQGSRLWLHEYRDRYFGENVGRLFVLEIHTWAWLPLATADDFEMPLKDIYGLRTQRYWPVGGHPARVLNCGEETK